MRPDAGERDIIFLLADGGMEQVLRGFLGREQFHRSLGCGVFDFDLARDVIVAPTKDPGVYGTAHELLRPYERSHRRAVVILDSDWNGSPGASAIHEHVTKRMIGRWSEFAVIVIDPELEAWIMNDNAHLARIFRLPGELPAGAPAGRLVAGGPAEAASAEGGPGVPEAGLQAARGQRRLWQADFRNVCPAVPGSRLQQPARSPARLVPGATVKLADPHNPVRYNWLADQGFRLDSSPYLSGAYEARKLLERIPGTQSLRQLTTGHDGGIFNGPKFSRLYTNDLEWGFPFLGSTDMLEADFTNTPLLHKKVAKLYPYLEIKPGMTMITCSGTIGRTTYVRPDMAGFWSSQHTMKVNPDPGKVPPGYLYAFLQSKYGMPIVVSSAYGAIIQHIEPHQLVDLPVPRFDPTVEDEIHQHVQSAAELRAKFQAGVTAATLDLFESAGLPELIDFQWYRQPRATGFKVNRIGPASLRAMNYDDRARKLSVIIASVPHRTLGDICDGGELSRGNRFTRIPADPGHGCLLIGQEQVFWTRPEGRWVAVKKDEAYVLHARDETIVVASQGLLTEGCTYRALSVHHGPVARIRILRALAADQIRGHSTSRTLTCLPSCDPRSRFACCRSLVSGTGPQDINAVLRRAVPVPECTSADRERIAETVRQAYRWRDEADQMEDRAQELLQAAVRAAAGIDLRQDGDLAYKPQHKSREADRTDNGGDHRRRRARQ